LFGKRPLTEHQERSGVTEAQHDLAWLLDQLAERDARIAELEARLRVGGVNVLTAVSTIRDSLAAPATTPAAPSSASNFAFPTVYERLLSRQPSWCRKNPVSPIR
jgi:hypothetical protein